MSPTAKGLNILILEPFYSGSHLIWAEGLQKYSSHSITLSTLPGRHWKWRMHGAAVTFAEKHKEDIHNYDLILVTDMCDVATFRGLLKIDVPVIVYFHENQLAYPWSSEDEDVAKGRDRRYQWINFTSALSGDHLWFNSSYNMNSFLDSLPDFLHPFPDYNKYDLRRITNKSKVVPLGLELKEFLMPKQYHNEVPTVLWNHRWEYDKQPEIFFRVLYQLHEQDIDFRLVVLGTHTQKYPPIFDKARTRLKDKILHFGPVKRKEEYISWVKKCDVLPVTSAQDFFGISAVEAMAGGVVPLLPEGLAFEEHIPKESYPQLFYHSDEDLYNKLKYLLREYRKYNIVDLVEHYDWTEKTGMYDNLFEMAGNDL